MVLVHYFGKKSLIINRGLLINIHITNNDIILFLLYYNKLAV